MIERRKLTVADFLLMGETGVFAPDERVELLDGEVYKMSPPSLQHAGMVKRIAKLLEQAFYLSSLAIAALQTSRSPN